MSIFRPAAERRVANMSGMTGTLSELQALRGIGSRAVALSVTPTVAMKHSAVNACTALIANLAALDVHAYGSADGMDVRIPDPPLLVEPSSETEPAEWRRQVFMSWLTRGTVFGWVARQDNLGRPTQIELLPAEEVSVSGMPPFGPWEWRVGNKPVDRYPYGPLWVSRGLHTMPGIPVGISPIEMACAAIGLGLEAENFGASWFYDSATPSALLYTDQQVDETQARIIKDRFIDTIRGKREPAVMGAGIKYQAVQVAANESQFLETLDRNVATVCRFWLVPPEEVGASAGNSMTYQNAEARANALLTRTYQPWLQRLESSLTRTAGVSTRVDVSGLIRTDIKTRTAVDGEDIRVGVRSRNEVRRTRGLAPIEGGDEYLWPPYRAFPLEADFDNPKGGQQ